MIIIGIIHQSFLCQRKINSSLNIPSLDVKFFIALIFASFYLDKLPRQSLFSYHEIF
jgi:hypothetical protein